jgi:N-acetylneuraminate synthase
MIVNGKSVDHKSDVYLIAEIGINHNGNIDTAKKLIDEAVIAGFDAVKFQKRNIAIVYSKEELDRPRESVFGNTNSDLKYGLEFNENHYTEIDDYCKSRGIDWFASAWDITSVDFLENFGVVAHKVASACNSDRKLLERLSETGKPIFLSTGMSEMNLIKKAVQIFDSSKLVLMHTVSTYPARNDELNLNWINLLRKEFPNIPIGYSGHEVGILPSVIAVSKYEACCVERHITLDRSAWGTDQSASLEPNGMRKLVRDVREISFLHGTQEKIVLDSEVEISRKLRRVNDI